MKKLMFPTYSSKEEIYQELDSILSEIPAEEVFLAHFKTPEFIHEEKKFNIINHYSIRDTEKNLSQYKVVVPEDLSYKIATCFFSENRKTLGLKKHFHHPKTDLPTITIGKKIFQGQDKVSFNFFRKNAPDNFILKHDFVLRFNSSKWPHEVLVEDGDQSVWLFVVFEHCGEIDLKYIQHHFNCPEVYDYL